MSFSVGCDMKFEMSIVPSVLKNRKAGEGCLLRNSRAKSDFRHDVEGGSLRFSFSRPEGRRRTISKTIFPCRVAEF